MIPLHIKYEDGTAVELDARPFAIELWERETKQKMFALSTGAGLGDLLRIAYHELKLSGETLPKYDEWAATITSIIEDDDPKEGAPPA